MPDGSSYSPGQGETVVYFDTESFSVDRFSQIAGDEAEALLIG